MIPLEMDIAEIQQQQTRELEAVNLMLSAAAEAQKRLAGLA